MASCALRAGRKTHNKDAVRLDAELLATANAFRANQPEAACRHIEILLDLLHREHDDLDHEEDAANDDGDNKTVAPQTKPKRINRLAAQVLDFDLKYVLKRTEAADKHGRDDDRKSR